MIAQLFAVFLALQSPPLSPQAEALIAPVQASIDAEEARQAGLPAPATPRERLERMGELDQAGRNAAVAVDLSALPPAEGMAAQKAMWAIIETNDRALAEDLMRMIPPEGWFFKSIWGEQAAGAAFLIVQHSDLEMWRRFVPVLEPLVATGEVDGEQYALMFDRLAINEGRPQRYGTQMICKGGRFVVDTVEDPDNIDAIRRDMGFSWTMAEYEAIFADYPPCTED